VRNARRSTPFGRWPSRELKAIVSEQINEFARKLIRELSG
jgi:hypothetical protein